MNLKQFIAIVWARTERSVVPISAPTFESARRGLQEKMLNKLIDSYLIYSKDTYEYYFGPLNENV